jgi:hypothetical protein
MYPTGDTPAAELAPAEPVPPIGRRGRNQGPITKLTVNVTARSIHALEVGAELNADTETDTVNRALQVYAFLTHFTAQGCDLLLRHPDGELEKIQIF